MQIVDIINKGDIPIYLVHNGDKYTVEVDSHKIVPYECAASAFGDPRARDNGRDRGRTDVYEHTRAMWNYNLGFDTAADWEEKRPKFEAFDVNSQEQIWFVIDDPLGTKAADQSLQSAPPDAVTSDNALIAAQLREMQAQMAQLTAALALSQNSASGVSMPAPEVVVAATADGDEVTSAPVAVPTATQELPVAPEKPAKVVADGPTTSANRPNASNASNGSRPTVPSAV